MNNQEIRYFDLTSGAQATKTNKYDMFARGQVFAPNGKFMAYTGRNLTLEILDLDNNTIAVVPETPIIGSQLGFTGDSKYICWAGGKGLKVVDVSAKKVYSYPYGGATLALSPGGGLAAVISRTSVMVVPIEEIIADSKDDKKPEDKSTDGLGGAIDVLGYVVQPPKGYRAEENPAEPGVKILLWGGEKRPDGSEPRFGVLVATAPPGEKMPGTVDQMLADALRDPKKKYDPKTWKQSPFNEEMIGGLKFKMSRWSGQQSKDSKREHGFMMVAFDGRTIILIQCLDAEPHHEISQRLAEKAARTFKKK
jgi:hypothetical protein